MRWFHESHNIQLRSRQYAASSPICLDEIRKRILCIIENKPTPPFTQVGLLNSQSITNSAVGDIGLL